MTAVLLIVATGVASLSLVLSGISLALHAFAPKATATKDVDAVLKGLDEIKGLLPKAPQS